MSEFRFRLQRVLDYRALAEGWAKDAYLEARAARLEAVAGLESIEVRRGELLMKPADALDARLAMQACLDRMEDEERQQRVVIEMLEHDEATRKEEWTEARRELQVLERLRESAYAEWMLEENRREQKELDEWSVTRRAA